MKKPELFLLLFLFICNFLYSREAKSFYFDDGENLSDAKQMMSFNATNALLGQYGLEYELKLGDKVTFWANGGMVMRYYYFNYNDNIGFKFIEPKNMGNFAGAGFKYYFSEMFSGLNTLAGINRINLSSEKFMATELIFSAGYQFNLAERFSADLSLASLIKFGDFAKYSNSNTSSIIPIPLINLKICRTF